MHGYDNKSVGRDGIVNRVPPTLCTFVTNNNKLIQFMVSFFCRATQLFKKNHTKKNFYINLNLTVHSEGKQGGCLEKHESVQLLRKPEPTLAQPAFFYFLTKHPLVIQCRIIFYIVFE